MNIAQRLHAQTGRDFVVRQWKKRLDRAGSPTAPCCMGTQGYTEESNVSVVEDLINPMVA